MDYSSMRPGCGTRIFLYVWIILAFGEARNFDGANLLDYEDLDKDTEAWIQSEITTGRPEDLEHNRHILETIPQPYYITYPVQVRKKQALDLDTHDPDSKHKDGHYRHTSIHLTIFGKKVKLQLELNRELLSRGLMQKINIDEKTQSSVEGCFYQGKVRKEHHSLVAVSTCNGISGIIHLRNDSYIIQPLDLTVEKNETRFPHVVYKTQTAPKKTCANDRGHWLSYKELHIAEHLRNVKIMKSQVYGTKEDPAVIKEVKYLDLALVCDHALFEKLNSSVSAVLSYLLQMANIIDAYFKREKIRINVVYIEVWNHEDQFHVSNNPRENLHSFLQYRERTINPSSQELSDSVEPDVAHFIAGRLFGGDEVGMAVPDSVCTTRAVSVSQDTNVQDPQQLAATIAHMIAHNLGMHHERVPCSCSSYQGCIMSHNPLGTDSQHPLLFGSCSEDELRESLMSKLGTCLFKKPAQGTFKQICGNGVLERGEECDCQSPEDCAKTDPCCDPHTCLLKPWATCRYGDCCYNCTVMPASTKCRAPETECDAPEFCDGVTGQCPKNVLMQDGWPCREGESYCYEGHCPTRADQCHAIWGGDAVPADKECYARFNPTGNFNGHCGTKIVNDSSVEYYKCKSEHVMCGLLHCAGGTDDPLVGKDFSQTKVSSKDITYQCKTLNGFWELSAPNISLVVDGTKCSEGGMCINAQCVPITDLVVTACLAGDNGQICSGNGICTSDVKCLCDQDYAGPDCSIKLNRTKSSQETTPVVPRNIPTSSTTEWVPLPTVPSKPPISTTTEPVGVSKKASNAPTLWLVIVLASVAGGGLLVLGCCMLCYRRRSPHKDEKKNLKHKNLYGMTVISGSPVNDKDSGDEAARNRLISFGNMPSYRIEKRKKAQRRLAGASETESEHSRSSQRESTEIKVPHTLPLARPPDRGILKNMPRSADNIKSLADADRKRPMELLPLIQGCRPPLDSPRNGSVTELKFVDSEETGERTRDVGVQGDMEGDDISCSEDGSCCGSSCSSLDKKDEYTPSDCEEGEEGGAKYCGNSSFCGSDISQREMPRDSSSDSLEGAKNRIIKLKNINELLKQIDEQFNTVLKQTQEGTLSPGGSDDMAGSDTEADRSFPRNSFYKQSDIEEGYSPPHRSPLLSPNPPSLHQGSDKHSSYVSSSDKRSSNLSASSPEPLPSPSFILSPIRHRSPPRFMSPIHEGMKMPMTSSPRKHSPSRCKSPPKRTSPGATRQTSPSRIPVLQSPSKENPFTYGQQGHVGRLRSPNRQSPPGKSGSNKRSPSPLSSPSGKAASPPKTTSPGRRRHSPHRNAPSPPNQNFVEPPLNAVPYRGAKTSSCSSIPGSPPPVSRKDRAADSQSPGSAKHLPDQAREKLRQDRAESESPSRDPAKLTNPYLDSSQFQRGSFSNDGQSNSEGYHSDRADSDTFIVREIPVSKRNELRATPHQRISYTKTMGSNESVNL